MSLGLVNDLLEDDIIGDDDEDPRQAAGDELVSSTSKWHKHTVKVFSLLKRNMSDHGDDESKPDHISFNALSKGSSRRTAAGVYFELLQLKTWDYINVEQSEPYGDIIISPGVKFAEDPPTN